MKKQISITWPVKFILVALAFSTALFGGGNLATAASLQELQQKQAELDRQIQSSQNQLNSQKKEVHSIQEMVNSLDSQIKLTQQEINAASNKIDLKSEAIDSTSGQIEQRQKELEEQKEKLYETMRTVYQAGDQSMVEILASSNSLSDLVDRSQYLESLGMKIDEQVTSIKSIKASLENQKTQLEKDREELSQAKNSLLDKKRNIDIQQAQKSRLLGQVEAEKSQTQSSLNHLSAERHTISAEIYAMRQARGGIRTGSSNYPFASSTPDLADPWGFATRECTSYAAWYWNDILGKSWYNTRPGSGSAWNWPALASDQGYSVSSTPQAGAIVSWDRGGILGQYGHVAIVMSVNGDGSFNLSEYNWIRFAYSERYNVSTDGARFIY